MDEGLVKLVHAHDWGATALGPMADWPESLRTASSICLNSCLPTVIFWGPDYVALYNGAYAEILARKHPWALGRPRREVWPEIWNVLEPMLEGVAATGISSATPDLRLTVDRRGYPEECYLSLSLTPLCLGDGDVAGVFSAVRETTARVMAERALQKSEAQLREAERLARVGSWEYDLATDASDWSDELYRICGVDRHSFTPRYDDFRALVHPDDRAGLDALVERALERHDPYACELRIIRPDGEERVTQSRGAVLLDDAGKVVRLHGIVQDVTERKLVEQALRMAREQLEQRVVDRTEQLRRANERVEMVLDSITDQFFAFDSGYRFTYMNRHAAEQMRQLGKDPERLIGKVLWQEFPSLPYLASVDRVIRERIPVTEELYYRPLRQWLEYRMFPTHDGGIAVFQSYVTERKRAEDELRRSQSLLAEGQRLTKTGSWGWKTDSEEVYWSQEQLRIFGFDPAGPAPTLEQAVQLIHPEDWPAVRRTLARVPREPYGVDWHCRIVALDGSVKHVHMTAHPVFDDGKLTEYRGTTMDITDRINAEEALRQSTEALAHATRVTLMGELSTCIGHELNQPLAAIVTNASACLRWLGRNPPDLDEARKAIERIVGDGSRAGDILRWIREFAKRRKARRDRLDIEEVITELAAVVKSEAAASDVRMDIRCAPDLQPVLGDKGRLQQVLLNLVMNGIEAMSRRGEPQPPADETRQRLLQIQCSMYGTGQVLVAVTDSGPGFDPAHAEQFFDAFFTTKTHGLGMGLAISRSIIESHGGRMWASQAPGKGATFQFLLPAADGAAEGDDDEAPARLG